MPAPGQLTEIVSMHAPVQGTQQAPWQGLGVQVVEEVTRVPLQGVPSGMGTQPASTSQQMTVLPGGQGLGVQSVEEVMMVPVHGRSVEQVPLGKQHTCCGHGLGLQVVPIVPPTAVQKRVSVKTQILGQQHAAFMPTQSVPAHVRPGEYRPPAATQAEAGPTAHPEALQHAPKAAGLQFVPGRQEVPTP